MGFAHMGYDNLHDFIPFNTARAVHTNLLVVWLLSGFMGAAYYIIPEEAENELVSVKWAYIQLISLAVVGVVAISRIPLQLLGRKEIPGNTSTFGLVGSQCIVIFRLDSGNLLKVKKEPLLL
jgi:nitric oxide reductase large subunit